MGAARFVNGLAQHLTATPTINLYACNTAGTVAGGGQNFATAVQEQLTNELREMHGESAQASVWGHTSARHTTFNPDLVGVGAGGNFRTNLATRLVDMAIAQRGASQVSDDQRARLQTAAETVFRNVFDVHRRAGDASVGSARLDRARNFTGSNDPRQTYFRDIPLLGADRVWSDLTAASDPTDYGDLGMSEAGANRMATGAAFFRTRFQAQLATFNTQANTVLGSEPQAESNSQANPEPTPPPNTQTGPSPQPQQQQTPQPTPQPAPEAQPNPPAPTARHGTLRIGARGEPVRELQTQLNAHHAANPPLEVDGAFGSLTLAAVRRFQAAHDLSVDGVVGSQTWAALMSSPQPQTEPQLETEAVA
jgi:hypothetical protein